MSDIPILFVAGLGRCGTTMVMTMLDRGGFPVAGDRPDYEVATMMPGRVDLAWVRRQAGSAVKWVDPLSARISRNDLPVRPVIIHMDRTTREQALSQIKLLGIPTSRNLRRRWTKSLVSDKARLRALLDHTGTTYSFTFEWVLDQPEQAAQKLAAIIAHEFQQAFDHNAAALVPKFRSSRCANDLSIEAGL
jgi:hypothetical protein